MEKPNNPFLDMTATNHALTGALIGLTMHHPLLAIPLALGSHFVLDAFPHFGMSKHATGTKGFRFYLVGEALVCMTLVSILFLAQVDYWLLASVCAFLATSPDFMWVPEFIQAQLHKKQYKPSYTLARFHSKIQWFQRPIGAVVEVIWLIGIISLLVTIT